jgi:hypothetical protein
MPAQLAIRALPARAAKPNQEGCIVRKLIGVVVAICTLLLYATFAPSVLADQWDKKTVVTFSDSVEIPGQVLPAGTYIFKLANSLSNRHIVQIWNADENEILATIMTVPATRFEAPDDSLFEFDERPSDSPPALKMWFYPGNSTGEEFIYSNTSYSKGYSNRQ